MVDVSLRRFVPSDLQWVVARHQDLYAREAGFDASFGVLVAEILQRFCASHDPACERGWVAVSGAERLGTIFCVKESPETARLRLFLLTPKARGQGLGKRLLRECVGFARSAGYGAMVLHTHESHRSAQALYQAFGWQMTGTRPVRNYGQDLVEQTWRLELRPDGD
ncbi:GNAT family N-acetyltransferase [Cribrihabitans pelagius]|uniref:GNAT family N-acetyltransferase n=1 Tax=Cribrihabitans pelagius TaxID=1765746 RepID=UPI003B5A0214